MLIIIDVFKLRYFEVIILRIRKLELHLDDLEKTEVIVYC
jgi:hypothetical protein